MITLEPGRKVFGLNTIIPQVMTNVSPEKTPQPKTSYIITDGVFMMRATAAKQLFSDPLLNYAIECNPTTPWRYTIGETELETVDDEEAKALAGSMEALVNRVRSHGVAHQLRLTSIYSKYGFGDGKSSMRFSTALNPELLSERWKMGVVALDNELCEWFMQIPISGVAPFLVDCPSPVCIWQTPKEFIGLFKTMYSRSLVTTDMMSMAFLVAKYEGVV